MQTMPRRDLPAFIDAGDLLGSDNVQQAQKLLQTVLEGGPAQANNA